MVTKSEEIQIELKKKIGKTLRKNGVVKAGVFGSFSRGKAKKNSDVDILIQYKERKSLLDLAGLEIELEKKLGRKVDLLTYDSLHPLLKKKILAGELKII